MGSKVYENCAGFLQIVTSSTIEQDCLDATRIHPEVYEEAEELSKIALDENNDDGQVDRNEIIEAVMLSENSHMLSHLDQEQWGNYLSDKTGKSMLNNVRMIIEELQRPYHEVRNQYCGLTWTEIFELLSGEVLESPLKHRSQLTLYNGALVAVRILKIFRHGLLCVTESGVKGMVKIEDFSDQYDSVQADLSQGPEYSLDSHVSIGQTITVRVMDMIIENAFPTFDERSHEFRRRTPLSLCCRASVLNDHEKYDSFKSYCPPKWFRTKDDALEANENARRKREREQNKGKHARQIDHPNFKNIDKRTALAEMEADDGGAFVIRPSTQGRDTLIITWKFARFEAEQDPDIYIHIDVTEQGLTENVTVGSAFKVGDEKFEDLDELIASYIEPRIARVNEMFEFRKYCPSKEDVCTQKLLDEKAKGEKVPYLIMASREKAGRFVLMYQTKKLIREFIMVRSDGFWYRKQCFQKPEQVIKYFKKNFSKPIPR